jgi:uncharacterized protein (UPF0335 family)
MVLRLNQETIVTDFKLKSEKIVSTGFDVKPEKIILVVLKDRRRRPEEEGVNESQSKILYEENLTYIPSWTRRPSLLTRSRPPSYR